jgi:hypothetical protein
MDIQKKELKFMLFPGNNSLTGYVPVCFQDA